MSNKNNIKESRCGQPEVLILGGGLAGLWAGYQLQQKGFKVEILEKEKSPGGLLKTIYKDGFYFDFGPHIFLEPHLPYYRELVGDEIGPVKGFYGIGFRGKQIFSPINPFNLLKTVGIWTTIPMVNSMLWGKAGGAFSKGAFENVDQLLSARFGARINSFFFRDYVPKVTGTPSTDVSHHWFSERYRFYQEHNLWGSLLSKSLTAAKAIFRKKETEAEDLVMYYPRQGAQMITDALAKKIQDHGGSIRVNTEVDYLQIDGGRITSVGYHSPEESGEISSQTIISTLPVTDLIRKIQPPPPTEIVASADKLSYRRLALYFLILKRERLSDKIQIYFPENQYNFKRIYEPKNLDATTAPSDKTGICVEVCFSEADGTFEGIKDNLYESVLEGINDFYGVSKEEVEAVYSIEVPYAYAIYKKGYEGDLTALARYFFDFDNLISYGRQGSFRYNHLVDRVIDAFEAVQTFIQSGESKKTFLKEADSKSDFF